MLAHQFTLRNVVLNFGQGTLKNNLVNPFELDLPPISGSADVDNYPPSKTDFIWEIGLLEDIRRLDQLDYLCPFSRTIAVWKPEDLCEPTIVSIYWEDDRLSFKNHRGISLISIASRLLCRPPSILCSERLCTRKPLCRKSWDMNTFFADPRFLSFLFWRRHAVLWVILQSVISLSQSLCPNSLSRARFNELFHRSPSFSPGEVRG